MEKGWIGCGATIDTTIEIKSGRKQNFMQGIKDKIVVITGASSESIRERAAE
jgi:predicted ABC-class ATPase